MVTDRHDSARGPEDDDIVRQALMSLMDDVMIEPLPDPAQIRARAEGISGEGEVLPFAPSRRRRSLAYVAAAAAAVLVATGAGLAVLKLQPDTSQATTTSGSDTSTMAGPAKSQLTMLDASDWTGALGVPITGNKASTLTAQCFSPPKDGSWRTRGAQLEDGTTVASQWIGSSKDAAALTQLADAAVQDCQGYTAGEPTSEDLPKDAAYRAWQAHDGTGGSVWWVEVTAGQELSFLTVAEGEGRQYSPDEIRRLALGVSGQIDLSQVAPTTRTPGKKTTTTDPSSDSPTTTTDEPSGSGSGSASTSGPTPPANTPTPPDLSDVDHLFIPESGWSSATLTGGRTPQRVQLPPDGGLVPCTSAAGEGAADGAAYELGGRSFARQLVLTPKAGESVNDLFERIAKGLEGCAKDNGDAYGSRFYELEQNVFDPPRSTYYSLSGTERWGAVVLIELETDGEGKPLSSESARRELARLSEKLSRIK